jgi:hypothetical protein
MKAWAFLCTTTKLTKDDEKETANGGYAPKSGGRLNPSAVTGPVPRPAGTKVLKAKEKLDKKKKRHHKHKKKREHICKMMP